jgi:hypothetical protein
MCCGDKLPFHLSKPVVSRMASARISTCIPGAVLQSDVAIGYRSCVFLTLAITLSQ